MFGFSGKLAGTLSSETSIHMLSQLGMGNMGEGRSLCAEATEATVLALQCGKSLEKSGYLFVLPVYVHDFVDNLRDSSILPQSQRYVIHEYYFYKT